MDKGHKAVLCKGALKATFPLINAAAGDRRESVKAVGVGSTNIDFCSRSFQFHAGQTEQ